MEQERLQAFLQWLPSKFEEFQNKTPDEVAQALNELYKTDQGKKTLEAMWQAFLQEGQGTGPKAPPTEMMFKEGGKLNYLLKFAKGGKMCECGCTLITTFEKGGVVEKCACGCKSKSKTKVKVTKKQDGGRTLDQDWKKFGNRAEKFENDMTNTNSYILGVGFNPLVNKVITPKPMPKSIQQGGRVTTGGGEKRIKASGIYYEPTWAVEEPSPPQRSKFNPEPDLTMPPSGTVGPSTGETPILTRPNPLPIAPVGSRRVPGMMPWETWDWLRARTKWREENAKPHTLNVRPDSPEPIEPIDDPIMRPTLLRQKLQDGDKLAVGTYWNRPSYTNISDEKGPGRVRQYTRSVIDPGLHQEIRRPATANYENVSTRRITPSQDTILTLPKGWMESRSRSKWTPEQVQRWVNHNKTFDNIFNK